VTSFAFATCLPGLEAAVKLDVARARPELRFAYSRPGLVTFKSSATIDPADPPGTPFARVWGASVGASRDPGDAAHTVAGLGVARVHVFARELGDEVRADLSPWREALAPFAEGSASDGELVADVIVADGEPAWIGMHRQDEHHLPHAGGVIPVDVPADAPSRAFAKIEEAIAWAQLPVERGQVALEIGAAPGGAVMALARRGVEVWGVDTGELAPQVLALPGVHHLPIKVGALRWEQLPPRVDWLLVDVNLAPQVALHEVARLMPRLAPTLRGAVITLKLNDLAFVHELPKLVARVQSFGFADVQLRHLPSNRREICCVARYRA
jgi:23S rRNA (cytidine2498-2'-O)-methyltransferase